MSIVANTPPSDSPRRRGVLRRFLFRFAVVYFILYALPFPFTPLISFLSAGANILGYAKTPEWIMTAWGWVSEYTQGWQGLTTWMADHDWVSWEVIHQRTGSGDTGHDLATLVVCAATAFLLALGLGGILFLLRRGREASPPNPQPGRWLHLSVRWYVGVVLMGYGLLKLYATQFGDPSLTRLTEPLGEMSPMGLVWTFMAFSDPYEAVGGLGETIGALLLFWRRTSLLGCLVLIPVVGNVACLNWLYDVPVKFSSTHLLVFTVLLLIPDLKRLWALLITNRPVPPADLALTPRTWLRWTIMFMGFLWVGVSLYGNHKAFSERNARQKAETPALYGVWSIQSMRRGDAEIPATDVTRWKEFAIDRRDRAWFRTLTGDRQWLTIKIVDGSPSTATVSKPQAKKEGEPPPKTEEWTLTSGETEIEVPHPEPRTSKERNEKKTVSRRTLRIQGSFEGVAYDVQMVQRVFNLNRGFHLIQEIPYNR